MSNQKTAEQSIVLNKIKVIASGLALAVSLLAALGYPPVYILSLFFLYQTSVQFIAYFMLDVESRFVEDFWVGSAKLALPVAMIASGIPKENSFWGLVWIGIAVLFMVSGIRSLHFAAKSFRGGSETAPSAPSPVSTRQSKKVEKQEEALLADLAAFLDDPDSSNK